MTTIRLQTLASTAVIAPPATRTGPKVTRGWDRNDFSWENRDYGVVYLPAALFAAAAEEGLDMTFYRRTPRAVAF